MERQSRLGQKDGTLVDLTKIKWSKATQGWGKME